MTVALCTGCGAMKFGAFLACSKCHYKNDENRDLDTFFSDHYLDSNELNFLGIVVSKIRTLVPDESSTRNVFLFYISKNIKGLISLELSRDRQVQLENILTEANIPTMPKNLVFNFNTPIKKQNVLLKQFKSLKNYFTPIENRVGLSVGVSLLLVIINGGEHSFMNDFYPALIIFLLMYLTSSLITVGNATFIETINIFKTNKSFRLWLFSYTCWFVTCAFYFNVLDKTRWENYATISIFPPMIIGGLYLIYRKFIE